MKQKITLEFRAKKTLVVDGPISISDLKAMIPELLPDGWGLFDARMTGEPYRGEPDVQACGCGEPRTPGIEHRVDAPCYYLTEGEA